MDYTDITKELKIILASRFPGKTNYIPQLADILNVHPKTVYRKLHGETEFSFLEILKIVKSLDISLDSIFICRDSNTVKHPMEVYVLDYSMIAEFQKLFQSTLQFYTFAADSARSTYMVAGNNTPDIFNARYEWIGKFSYLKWIYFNKKAEEMINLSDIVISEESKELHRQYWNAVSRMKRSIYVFHIDMMKHIAADLSFFYNMGYVTREDISNMIVEYRRMLDELEEVCNNGFTSTGKEINVYYSEMLLSNDLTVIDSDNIRFGISYSHYFNPVVTKNINMYEIVKGWFYSQVRSSNYISISEAKKRMFFFNKQRNDLEELEKDID